LQYAIHRLAGDLAPDQRRRLALLVDEISDAVDQLAHGATS
jgi:hypothetical protein